MLHAHVHAHMCAACESLLGESLLCVCMRVPEPPAKYSEVAVMEDGNKTATPRYSHTPHVRGLRAFALHHPNADVYTVFGMAFMMLSGKQDTT